MKTKINKSRRRGHASGVVNRNAGPAVSGFTLLEVMIATALFGLVVAGTFSVYVMCNKIWHAASINMQAVRESSLALSRMVYGVETNNGLRSAGMVLLLTNAYGHPYPFADTNKYWITGAKPPSAAADHSTHVGCSYGTDGSWRLIISNTSDGVKCIDYNSKMRNILFCPDTNTYQSDAARQKRILICNYVSAARVTTNASGTVAIQVTVAKQDGMFTASNTVTTTVKMRNKI